jgi:cell division protein FtsA
LRDPRGMAGQRLEADMHSVLVDPLVLRNIALCLKRCHIEMAGFAAPAYVSGLCTLASVELLGGGGVIDMGAGVTSVAIFANGRMIFSGAVKRGGQQITRDLAKVFSLTLGEAERLKTLYGCVFCEAGDENGVIVLPTTTNGADERWLSLPRPEVAAIIRRRQEDVLEAIAGLLDQAGFRRRDALNFVLTGGGSQLIGAEALAERVLEGPARLGAPPPLFGGPSPEIGPAFSAAVGLLTFLHEDDWAFAFSPRAARPASYLARVGEWLRHSF